MMDKILLDAVGTILREERSLTDSQIERLEEKLAGSNLVPKFAVAEIEARKSAIDNYVSAMLYKRSEVVSKTGERVGQHLRQLDE